MAGMRAHEAGALHAEGYGGAAAVAALPRRRQRAAARSCGRAPSPATTTGVLDGRRRRRSPTLARRVRHARCTSSTRPTSAPAPAPSATRSPRRSAAGPGWTCTTPARRSCAPRSPAGSPRRGSASTSAPAASSRSRLRAGVPGRADRAARQQQVGGRDPAARCEAGVGRIVVDSLRRDRPASRPSPRELGVGRAGDGPRHRRRRGAHPRVHRHRPRGPEVRLLAWPGGDAAEAVRRGPRAPRAATCSGCTATSGRRSSTPAGFEVAAHRVLGAARRRSAREHGVRAARARPRRRLRHRLHQRRTTPLDAGDAGRPAGRASSSRECRGARASPVPRLSVEPGRAIVGPGHLHALRGRHGQGGRARRRARRARYVSVDGGMSDNIRTALYDADYSCTLASPASASAGRCSAGSSASTARAATSSSRRVPARRRRRPATCSPCRAPAPTAAHVEQLQPRAPPAGRRGPGPGGPRARAPRDGRRPSRSTSGDPRSHVRGTVTLPPGLTAPR